MAKNLELTIRNQCAILILNRPEIRNAFDDELIANLTKTLRNLDPDASVRCVVLAGAGPAFCAGADLNWMKRMAEYTREENIEDASRLARLLEVIYRCPKPTIARVHGDTYAGGVGLVAVCDMAVAADRAQF